MKKTFVMMNRFIINNLLSGVLAFILVLGGFSSLHRGITIDDSRGNLGNMGNLGVSNGNTVVIQGGSTSWSGSGVPQSIVDQIHAIQLQIQQLRNQLRNH